MRIIHREAPAFFKSATFAKMFNFRCAVSKTQIFGMALVFSVLCNQMPVVAGISETALESDIPLSVNFDVEQPTNEILVASSSTETTPIASSSANVPVISLKHPSEVYWVVERTPIYVELLSEGHLSSQSDLVINVKLENIVGNFLKEEGTIQVDFSYSEISHRGTVGIEVDTIVDKSSDTDGVIKATVLEGIGYSVVSENQSNANRGVSQLYPIYNLRKNIVPELSISASRETIEVGESAEFNLSISKTTFVPVVLRFSYDWSNGTSGFNDETRVFRVESADSLVNAYTWIGEQNSDAIFKEKLTIEILPNELGIVNYSIAEDGSKATVSMNWDKPRISISKKYGYAPSGTVEFRVSADKSLPLPLNVTVGIEGSSNFYTSTTRSIHKTEKRTVALGGNSLTETILSIKISGWLRCNGDEIRARVLSGPGYEVSKIESSATIIPPTQGHSYCGASISIRALGAVYEGEPAVFSIYLPYSYQTRSSLDRDINIKVQQIGGDYIQGVPQSSVRFSQNEERVLFSVPTVDDEIDEINGAIVATVLPGGYHVVRASSYVLVLDNDGITPADDTVIPGISVNPVISIREKSSTASEGETVDFEISTNGIDLDDDLTLNIIIDQYSGDSHEISFYTRVVIPEGESTAVFSVVTMSDDSDELDGLVTARFPMGTGPYYTFSETNNSASVVLLDPDKSEDAIEQTSNPVIGVESARKAVYEGETVEFILIAGEGMGSSEIDLNVKMRIENIHGDYLSEPEDIQVKFTENFVSFEVATVNDDITRPDGVIRATILDGAGYGILDSKENGLAYYGDRSASVRVMDDDPRPTELSLSLSVSSEKVLNNETAHFFLTFTSSPHVIAKFKYTYHRPDGSNMSTVSTVRVSGSADKSASKPVLIKTWTPSTQYSSFTLEILPDESYSINANAQEVTATLVANIYEKENAESPPTLSVSAVDNTVSEGGNAVFTISKASVLSEDLTVRLSVYNQHFQDLSIETRTVTLPVNQTSVEVSVATTEDDWYDTNYDITVTLLPGFGYAPDESGKEATVSVTDNDAPPLVSISAIFDHAIAEGEFAWFLISVDRASIIQKTVNVSVAESSFLDDDVPNSATIWPYYKFGYLKVRTLENILVEPYGEVTVQVNEGTGYSVDTENSSAKKRVVNIANPLPFLSITNTVNTLIEGESASFNISASSLPGVELVISLSVTQVGDYISGNAPEEITMDASSGSVELVVETDDDELDEADGSITVELVNVVGREVTLDSHNVATVYIMDNDEASETPTLRISSNTSNVMEGETAWFEITSNSIAQRDFAINVLIATNGVSTVETYIMGENRSTLTFPVSTWDDQLYGSERTIVATVVDDPGYEIDDTRKSASITVDDNESTPEISIEPINSWVTEGTPVWLLLKSSQVSTSTQTVNVSISENGGNYLEDDTPERKLTIMPNYRQSIEGLDTIDDEIVEGDGSITISILDGVNYQVNEENRTATVAVLDNDFEISLPTISVSSFISSVTEGGMVPFRIFTSYSLSTDIAVNVSIQESREFIQGEVPTEIVITEHNSTSLLFIQTLDNEFVETDGYITLMILPGNNYDISSERGLSTVRVIDNDSPLIYPIVSITSVGTSVVEGDAAEFTIISSHTIDADLIIDLSLHLDGDFFNEGTSETDAVTIVKGEISGKFEVETLEDDNEELDGYVTVTVMSNSDATIFYQVNSENYTSTVNITDDDDTTVISISAVATPVVESTETGPGTKAKAEFNITSTKTLMTAFTVNLDVRETGNMIAGALTETVELPAGQSSVMLRLDIEDDNVSETDSRITVSLESGTKYSVAESPDNSAFVDVLDNDGGVSGNRPYPLASISAVSDEIEEGDSVGFTVALNENSTTALDINVFWTVEGNFLTAGSRILSIQNGGREVSLDLGLTAENTIPESDGSVTATVGIGTGYQVNPHGNSDTISILDDDATPEPSRSEVLHQEVLANLLDSNSERTVEAVANRVEFAFNNSGETKFQLNGSNAIDDFVKNSGRMVNENGMDLNSLLSGSSFTLPLLPEGNTPASATLWGTGFNRDVSSNSDDASVGWQGESFIGHLGLDAHFGEGLLAGVVSVTDDSSVNFSSEDIEGKLDGLYRVRVTSIQPYLAWASEDRNTRLESSVGYGIGEVEIDYNQYDPESAESSRYSASIGGSDLLYSSESLFGKGLSEMKVEAEAWMFRQSVKDNGLSIVGKAVETRSLRLLAEGSLQTGFGTGTTFNPAISVGTRWDGGDVNTGMGIEMTGRADYQNPAGFEISGLGRMLVSNIRSNGEKGLKGELNYDSEHDGIGILTTLSPAWGDLNDASIQQLWDDGVVENGVSQANEGARLESEIGFGFSILDGSAVLTPFLKTELFEHSRNRYGVGSRFSHGSGMSFEFGGAYEPQLHGGSDRKVRLQGNIKW